MPTDLYGQAAGLLQGASEAEANAGRTYAEVGNMNLNKRKLGQESDQFQQGQVTSALEKAAAEQGATERTQIQEKGALERTKLEEQGKTERQFTTLTPAMVKGFIKSDPRGGWENFLPGPDGQPRKMQTDVLLGLYTARLKHEQMKPIKSEYTDPDGKVHTIVTSFNPDTGVTQVQEVSVGEGKDSTKGSKAPTEKDLRAAVDREGKFLTDFIAKNGIPGEGITGGLWERMTKGTKTVDFQKSQIAQHANIYMDSINKLKGMGANVDVDPGIENLAKTVGGQSNNTETDQYERRKTKDGKTALFDPKTKEFKGYEGQ